MRECLIFVGLPGAGKTTYYRQHFLETHARVSKDDWPREKDRAIRERKALEDAFTSGQSVVVDSTNPTVHDRALLISLARTHHATVKCYFFDVGTREAVARNAKRFGPARVPNVAIFTAAKRLQPPTYDEGFDALFVLTLKADGSLAIRSVPRGGD